MKYHEEATVFACAGDMLLGILAMPETPADTGVVVVVGGPQYRVGSHRQFLLLSRAAAAAGYPVLRFDYRGMGDSEGQPRDFLAVDSDIAAAIDALYKNAPSVKQVALWGLCDGASAALLYCRHTNDLRVRGVCLLNPWIRSAASLARTQVKHYYVQRLAERAFWLKFLSGKVAWGALRSLASNVRAAFPGAGSTVVTGTPLFQTAMAQAIQTPNRSALLLLSERDYTAKEFLEYAKTDAVWADALSHPLLQRYELPDADHTCSSAALRELVETRMLKWLMQLGALNTPIGKAGHGGD